MIGIAATSGDATSDRRNARTTLTFSFIDRPDNQPTRTKKKRGIDHARKYELAIESITWRWRCTQRNEDTPALRQRAARRVVRFLGLLLLFEPLILIDTCCVRREEMSAMCARAKSVDSRGATSGLLLRLRRLRRLLRLLLVGLRDVGQAFDGADATRKRARGVDVKLLCI